VVTGVSILSVIGLVAGSACLWLFQLVVTQEFRWWGPILARWIARLAALIAPRRTQRALLADLEELQAEGTPGVLFSSKCVFAATRMHTLSRSGLARVLRITAVGAFVAGVVVSILRLASSHAGTSFSRYGAALLSAGLALVCLAEILQPKMGVRRGVPEPPDDGLRLISHRTAAGAGRASAEQARGGGGLGIVGIAHASGSAGIGAVALQRIIRDSGMLSLGAAAQGISAAAAQNIIRNSAIWDLGAAAAQGIAATAAQNVIRDSGMLDIGAAFTQNIIRGSGMLSLNAAAAHNIIRGIDAAKFSAPALAAFRSPVMERLATSAYPAVGRSMLP
jgi:hypothetical protein